MKLPPVQRFSTVVTAIFIAFFMISCSADELLVSSDLTNGVITGKVRKEDLFNVKYQPISTIPHLGTITTDINGAFRIENVKPGAYIIQTRTEHLGAAKQSIEVVAGKSSYVHLLLSKLTKVYGYIVGRVVYENGSPVAGAAVSIANRTIKTDSEGRFNLYEMEMGDAVLKISNEYGVIHVDTLDIDSYITTELNVVIPFSAVGKAPIITKGLVAYYPLDGSARDLSGNDHNGELIGSPSFVTSLGTHWPEHVRISGTQQQIRIPHSDALNMLPLTLAFWFAPDVECPANAELIGKMVPSTGEGYYFGTNAAQQYQASYVNLEYSNNIHAQELSATLGRSWTHVAIVVTLNSISLYENGKLISNVSNNQSMHALISPGDFLIQAKRSTRASTEWSSTFGYRLDELYLFNRALDESEILRLSGANWYAL